MELPPSGQTSIGASLPATAAMCRPGSPPCVGRVCHHLPEDAAAITSWRAIPAAEGIEDTSQGGFSCMEESSGERWITHYSSSHSILLVGEGDFSFSACLARAFGSARNITATSFLCKGKLLVRHWSAAADLEELKGLGCMPINSVDVNDMNKHKTLKKMKFDRIVFNFPHAGHDPLYCERHGDTRSCSLVFSAVHERWFRREVRFMYRTGTTTLTLDGSSRSWRRRLVLCWWGW